MQNDGCQQSIESFTNLHAIGMKIYQNKKVSFHSKAHITKGLKRFADHDPDHWRLHHNVVGHKGEEQRQRLSSLSFCIFQKVDTPEQRKVQISCKDKHLQTKRQFERFSKKYLNITLSRASSTKVGLIRALSASWNKGMCCRTFIARWILIMGELSMRSP